MSQPPAPDSDILSPVSGSPHVISPPDPGPDTITAANTSFSSSVAGSENTVIAREPETQDICWTNTMDSNMTDTSVDEPKYAKVQHKKRNSKIGSGNSTPKFKRKDTVDSGSSRFVHRLFLGWCYRVSHYSPLSFL